MDTEQKFERLRALLRSYGSCLVAYSGGVDSVFLAYVAHQTLGARALAVIADSPSLPRRELAEALALGERHGFPVRVVRTREFQNPNYLANPLNRCYFCKHELFETLRPIARAEGFGVIAYGENASDVADFRPGAEAAREFAVRAPLKEAGLTKEEIRQLSARLGLPTAAKPQMACLSSRVPHGQPVTPEKLGMIEAAENFLRDLGFREVRVRHHELPETCGDWRAAAIPALQWVVELSAPKEAARSAVEPKLDGGLSLARIELGADELPRLLENGLAAHVAAALQRIGYRVVTVDLRGYRRGGADAGAPGAAAKEVSG